MRNHFHVTVFQCTEGVTARFLTRFSRVQSAVRRGKNPLTPIKKAHEFPCKLFFTTKLSELAFTTSVAKLNFNGKAVEHIGGRGNIPRDFFPP